MPMTSAWLAPYSSTVSATGASAASLARNSTLRPRVSAAMATGADNSVTARAAEQPRTAPTVFPRFPLRA